MTIQSRVMRALLTGHAIARRVVNGILAAFALAALSVSAPALAQTGPSSSEPELKEIVVTGSYLRRTDIETASPVQVLTALDIERTGLTTVTDVVRTIAADNSGTLPTAFGNAFAAGASGVALRGLTVNSTLVLIDGRRAANYAVADDGQRSFVDLNTIPLDAVERIEILKDGASSAYGADAIAGVVNLILKKQYTGAEVSAEIGKGQHPGGATRRVTASYGVGDLPTDKYNAYFNFEYQGDDRILVGDRGFPYNTNDLSSIGGFNSLAGTPGSDTGTTSATVAAGTYTPGGAGNPILGNGVTQTGAVQPLTSCGAGTIAGSAPSSIAGLTDNYCTQNRTLYQDDQPAQQRIGVSTRFTVQISENMQAYLNANFYQSNVWVDNPPSEIQTSTPINTNHIALPPTLSNGSLNPNDPFAAQGQYAIINYSFGDIQNVSSYKNHNARLVTGLKGTVASWDIDSALVINHTWLDTELYGYLNGAALLSAIQNGTYNFVDPSKNTPQQRAAIAPNNIKKSTTDMDSIDIRVSRELAQLPGGPLGVALGAEVRYEAAFDPQLNPGSSYQGLGVSTAQGTRNVGALSAEFGLPVLKSLEFNVSGRYDHYSDFGGKFTPKAGFKWKPVKEFALRGTYSQGFRAPAFAENGNSSAGGFINLSPTQSPPFPANFCNANVHSVGYCLPYSVLSTSNGNPNIKPETSRSATFGVIFEPTSNPNASIDIYAIKKKDVIEPPNTGPALVAFLAGQPIPAGYTVTPDLPDPAFPASMVRPAALAGGYVNAAELRTDGIDIDLRGKFYLGNYGEFISSLSGTKIFSFKIIFPDGTSQQWVGTQAPYILSSGAGTPRYRAGWSNSWIYGAMTTSLNVHYVSGFQETGVDAYGSYVCAYNNTFCHVASFTYADLTGSYSFSEHLTGSFAIENVLDTKPPIDPLDYAGNNYNPTYHQQGIIGRFFKLGIAYKF